MIFIQAICGDTAPTPRMRMVESLAHVTGNRYELVLLPAEPDIRSACIAADNYRMTRACTEPEMVWVDWDVEIMSLPTLEPGTPAFVYGIAGDPPQPDCSYFYVNGCCDFFKKFLLERDNRNIKDTVYGWPQKVLRDKKVQKIAPSSYIHSKVSLTKLFPSKKEFL